MIAGPPLLGLTTERLVLRRYEPADFSRYAAMNRDPEVVQFLWPATPWSTVVARQSFDLLRKRNVETGLGVLAITRQSDGAVVGRVGLHTWLIPGEVELGYALAREVWGHGYAREASRALRDWAFEHLEIPRLISVIADPNTRSQGVARANGFTLAESRTWYGQPTTIWEMTRETWESGRKSATQ